MNVPVRKLVHHPVHKSLLQISDFAVWRTGGLAHVDKHQSPRLLVKTDADPVQPAMSAPSGSWVSLAGQAPHCEESPSVVFLSSEFGPAERATQPRLQLPLVRPPGVAAVSMSKKRSEMRAAFAFYRDFNDAPDVQSFLFLTPCGIQDSKGP